MRWGVLTLLVAAGLLPAQDGQRQANGTWPCVAGRAVDPSYLDISESTGGQLFLFQKNEVAQSSLVMSASHTHPATILRAVGHLSGTREYEFPIDSTVQSVLLMASLQCRNAIQVYRPNGQEMTAANSAQSVDLQAGRILRIDSPEAGPWRVRLTGSGLFVFSVLAKADITLGNAVFASGNLEVHLSGEVSDVKLRLVDAAGDPVSNPETFEPAEGSTYRIGVTPPVERFRVIVTGTDGSAWPFQRTSPVLFHARTE